MKMPEKSAIDADYMKDIQGLKKENKYIFILLFMFIVLTVIYFYIFQLMDKRVSNLAKRLEAVESTTRSETH